MIYDAFNHRVVPSSVTFQPQKGTGRVLSVPEGKEATAQDEQRATTLSLVLLSATLDTTGLDESAGQAAARSTVRVRMPF